MVMIAAMAGGWWLNLLGKNGKFAYYLLLQVVIL